MNLRNWSREHTLGLIIGIITAIVFIPIAMFIYGFLENTSFERLWFRFKMLHDEQSKFISLACIANLIWFHFSIKKDNYDRAMGFIVATFLFFFIILYLKFIL